MRKICKYCEHNAKVNEMYKDSSSEDTICYVDGKKTFPEKKCNAKNRFGKKAFKKRGT